MLETELLLSIRYNYFLFFLSESIFRGILYKYIIQLTNKEKVKE